MRNCRYILYNNSSEIPFDDYFALAKHIRDNMQLSVNSTSDVVYSLETPLELAVRLLNEIRSTTKLQRSKYSKLGEVFDLPESNLFIEIHEFVEKGKKIDGSPFVTQFNLDDLRSSEAIEKLSREQNITRDAAKKIIDDEIEMWERTETRAYWLLVLINLFFRGAQDIEKIEGVIKTEFPKEMQDLFLQKPNILTNILRLLNDIRLTILRNHKIGDQNCKIFANVGITAKLNGVDKKLYANINLIAIDANGVPHVYIFTASSKNELEQVKVKKLKRDYRLGTISLMLAQHGFNVKNSSLNLVTIQLTEEQDESIGDIVFNMPEDRKLIINEKGINILQYGGEVWKNLNNLIPVTINEALFSGGENAFYNTVMQKWEKMFPTHNIVRNSESKRVTYWIKDHVRPSSLPGKYWEFDDSFGNIVYISDSSPKETNAELREKVARELDTIERNATQQQAYFLRGIEKSINDNMPLSAIVTTSNIGAARIQTILGKYTTGDWEYKSLPKLELFGIACIQHKRTGQMDFIILTHKEGLSQKLNLGLGTTILGSFLKDYQTGDNVKLEATEGNIKLIQLLIALDESVDLLKDWKIGELKVMNVGTGETINVQLDHLISDYKSLCKSAELSTDNINKLERCFLSPLEILKNRVQSLVSCLSLKTYESELKKIQADLEGLSPFDKKAIAEQCLQLLILLKQKYTFFNDYDKALQNTTDELKQILMLGRMIAETYVYVTGDFYAVLEMLTLGTGKTNTLMNGQMLATADTLPYRNEVNLTRHAIKTFQLIRRDFVRFKEDFFENYVKKFWQHKGYGLAQNITIGNQRSIYINLYRRTADGKLDPNLVFQDPDDMTNNLTNEERAFLREVLWRINRRRFGLEKYDRDSEKVKTEKENAGIKWFWVPVLEAAGGSKINTEYFESNLKREFLEIVSFGQKAKEAFRREDMNVYTESERIKMIEAHLRNEIYNRYALSDSDLFERTKLLESQPMGFWETNVENIVLSYELVHLRRDKLNDILPRIQIIKFLIQAWGNDANLNTAVNMLYIENFEKQAIHNITLISDQEREYTHLVKKAKMAASYSMIVGNIIAPVRDFLEGIWKSIGIFVGDTWGKYKGFTKSDLFNAYRIVTHDSLTAYAGVTVCEALNQQYGIADMDYLLMDKKAKSGKVGLFNFSDKLWWTTTAGDYTNRMTLLVAKMLHDGCFYACKYDGGFKYDMKEDERFKIYLSGNTQHPKYKELRGLYITMLLEFNEHGYNLKDGDMLPNPYTPGDIVNVKTFADLLYGYYDHDLRIQLEKHALGSIFLQFCTYLTGSKSLWFLSPNYYETNIRELGRDAEGNPLYWQRVRDSEGNEALVIGITPTNEPYYPRAKSYMEGIYYTLRDFCNDTRNLGLTGAWRNIMECDAKKQNLRLLGYKLLMWAILGGIVKSLLDMWRDERKKDKSPYTVKRIMEDEGFNIVYKAVNGSAATFNLVEAFGGNVIDSEPPAFAVMTNMINSTIKVGKSAVTGNDFGKSLESWIYTNSAAYRSTSEIFRGIGKMSRATQNTID